MTNAKGGAPKID